MKFHSIKKMEFQQENSKISQKIKVNYQHNKEMIKILVAVKE